MHHLCAYKRGCLLKNSSKTTKKRIGQALKVTITKTKMCSPHSLETTEWKTGIFATITAMQKTQAREGEAESSTDAPSGPGRTHPRGLGRSRSPRRLRPGCPPPPAASCWPHPGSAGTAGSAPAAPSSSPPPRPPAPAAAECASGAPGCGPPRAAKRTGR